MKIKLSNTDMFEPNKNSIRSYILGVLAIIIVLTIFNYSAIWYFVFVGLETIALIWLETTYYPYGIKPEDLK